MMLMKPELLVPAKGMLQWLRRSSAKSRPLEGLPFHSTLPIPFTDLDPGTSQASGSSVSCRQPYNHTTYRGKKFHHTQLEAFYQEQTYWPILSYSDASNTLVWTFMASFLVMQQLPLTAGRWNHLFPSCFRPWHLVNLRGQSLFHTESFVIY